MFNDGVSVPVGVISKYTHSHVFIYIYDVLVAQDMTRRSLTSFLSSPPSLSSESLDLLFLPPGRERLLPAHPGPDQERAHRGRQVRKSSRSPRGAHRRGLGPRPALDG